MTIESFQRKSIRDETYLSLIPYNQFLSDLSNRNLNTRFRLQIAIQKFR